MNMKTRYGIGPLLPVPGFTASGLHSGIKKNGKPDLMLIASDRPASVAGAFTTNIVRAAPVEHSRSVVAAGSCQAIICNSGNANAYTGPQGAADCAEMAALTALTLGISADQVLVASTGVISQTLPMNAVRSGIPKVATELAADGWRAASEAILTTDLVAKCHSTTFQANGRTITVSGIAKGSGMIHPNMATMLAFVATDAPVASAHLQPLLADVTEQTFNRITVDGDTSTNDCVLLLANGAAGGQPLVPDAPEWNAFSCAVYEVCDNLARAIVADGEGATKMVTVTVSGLASEDDALRVARQIATSSLVKTALFGSDPNWGRLIAAAGQAGVPFDPPRASLTIGNVPLVKHGSYLGAKAEASCGQVMAGDEFTIELSLGEGDGSASVVTCDLSYDYVRINADYRS